ncbi:hypothetical protein EVAR_80329_1 [Eumeta japonica]|uniref:Uncharacterized protein n=1 Tax=Eumeta variegata TaxID=151549 RepID=A0A4C1WYM4_EUMVA|nr:hypothetical protein EVAR_80329_1 [Eumeta japonica]
MLFRPTNVKARRKAGSKRAPAAGRRVGAVKAGHAPEKGLITTVKGHRQRSLRTTRVGGHRAPCTLATCRRVHCGLLGTNRISDGEGIYNGGAGRWVEILYMMSNVNIAAKPKPHCKKDIKLSEI